MTPATILGIAAICVSILLPIVSAIGRRLSKNAMMDARSEEMFRNTLMEERTTYWAPEVQRLNKRITDLEDERRRTFDKIAELEAQIADLKREACEHNREYLAKIRDLEQQIVSLKKQLLGSEV